MLRSVLIFVIRMMTVLHLTTDMVMTSSVLDTKAWFQKQCAQELVGHMLNASVCLEKFGYLVTFILYILTR